MQSIDIFFDDKNSKILNNGHVRKKMKYILDEVQKLVEQNESFCEHSDNHKFQKVMA